MNNPKVSIIVATINRPELIKPAIESILKQRFQDWELIIVDDSQGDATEKLIKDFFSKDTRIRYMHRKTKSNVADASNFAGQNSSGEYVALLDDDDSWVDPDKLNKQLNFLDTHPDYIGCGGGLILIDEKGNEKLRRYKPETDKEIKRKALLANPMVNSTTVFRRSAAEKIFWYDASLCQFADWDFWLKMGLVGKLYNFQEYFTKYLLWHSSGSFLKQKGNEDAILKIVRRYKGQYPSYRFAIFMGYAYQIYTYLPCGIKKFTNLLLSQLKKALVRAERTPGLKSVVNK